MNNILNIYLLVVSVLLLSSCSKSGNTPVTPPATLPKLSILDLTQARDNKVWSTYRVFITVSASVNKDITVNYTTMDGTAVANNDFTPVQGTLTIPANASEGYIDVPVRGDSLRQADQVFYIQISNPVNATISGTGKATV
ncbi:MAG: Calx-beta domain-containing protein, partial [Bacteroidota bacterium]|nr:Calx-beta domain-containing protein [Bacteroidota bacterium]